MPAQRYSLVADIGGTNARFAMLRDGESGFIEPRSLICAEYETLVDAVEHYLAEGSCGRPHQAAISVASPVTGDRLNMTNHTWSFSVGETRAALGMDYLKVINDYTALALALPELKPEQCVKVGRGQSVPGHPMAVLGPGTGLGVSGAIPSGDHWVPLASEGGHVTYSPTSERAWQIVEVMREKRDHVSCESLVSGPGLAMTYDILHRLERGESRKIGPGEVVELAINSGCPIAEEALSLFCSALGNIAGNLALTLGARGGVYIGGGIVPRILDFFAASAFRERFEQHGRFTAYLEAIPTLVIHTDYPALIGAAAALKPAYEQVGVVSHEHPLS